MLAIMASACSFHLNLNGIAFTQEDVEKTIDEKLPTEYRQVAPDLPLGHAKCPDGLMQLDHGKVGHCTFELGMLSIPIVVTLDSNNQLQYKSDATFFDMNRVQPYIKSELHQSYGVIAQVDCGDPRYRVLKAGARLSCKLGGVPQAKIVNVKVLPNGNVFIFNPSGLQSAEAALTQPLIARHKQGKSVVVSGQLLERIFEVSLMPLLREQAAKQNVAIGNISCPQTADLSGEKRAICHFDASGRPIHVAFWIKNSDWNAESVEVMYPRVAIEAAATKYYQELERNNGFKAKVRVHCAWPDLLVVTPPASRDCVMTVDKDKRRLTVQIPNHSGTFNYYVWPTSNG